MSNELWHLNWIGNLLMCNQKWNHWTIALFWCCSFIASLLALIEFWHGPHYFYAWHIYLFLKVSESLLHVNNFQREHELQIVRYLSETISCAQARCGSHAIENPTWAWLCIPCKQSVSRSGSPYREWFLGSECIKVEHLREKFWKRKTY